MPSSVKEMLAAADAVVPRLTAAEFRDMIGKDNVLVVDIRDPPERALGGKIKGTVHASRGMLEFRTDPDSTYHNPAKTVVLYCGSVVGPFAPIAPITMPTPPGIIPPYKRRRTFPLGIIYLSPLVRSFAAA
jgi:hypothetical protein